MHGVWRMNDKFYLDAMIQYFSISYDVYDGRVTDYTASAVWQFSKHWGLVPAGTTSSPTWKWTATTSMATCAGSTAARAVFVNASF